MEPEDTSPVRSFFRGKVVFITGATGFMGKVPAGSRSPTMFLS